MRASPLVGLLAFLVSFSLCVQPGPNESSADPTHRSGIPRGAAAGFAANWADLALVGGGDHDHRSYEHHFNLSTPNFEVVGWNPLITDYYGRTAGSHLCGDAKEKDGRRLAVTHSFSSQVAFVIADVTDAANPQKIGELAMMTTHVYDLAVTTDFKYVLLATSPLGPSKLAENLPPPPIATFRDACTGEEKPVKGPESGLPYGAGLILVDITNPRNPTIADVRSFPVLGGHSVHVADVNGKPLIVTTVANLPGQTNYYVFMDILDTPAGPKLNLLSTYTYTPADKLQERTTQTAHDASIQKHPITGQWLAYLAYGDVGLVILNINDPKSPQFISIWDRMPDTGVITFAESYIHEALPIEGTWDGKHYTFLGDECGSKPAKAPTCLAYAIDTTDPKAPKMVGAWTLPVEASWSGGLMYSLHYLGLVNQTLFVTVYHGGLWAVDVSRLGEPGGFSLPSIGVFMPPFVSPKPPPTPSYTPRVNDLTAFSDGTMVVWDAATGLYMVRFDDGNKAPWPEPWPMTGPKA